MFKNKYEAKRIKKYEDDKLVEDEIVLSQYSANGNVALSTIYIRVIDVEDVVNLLKAKSLKTK